MTCAGPPPRSRPPWPTRLWDCLARARLLPAQVEIALADGDVEDSTLGGCQAGRDRVPVCPPALAAAAECAQAGVLLAEGDPAMAAAALRRGIALWRQAGAPYETAWARLLLGEALEQHGDRKHHPGGVRRRPAIFASLGAELDLQRATGLLAAT